MQKQVSYVSSLDTATTGGTQAPFASYKGPHFVAHDGSDAKGTTVVDGVVISGKSDYG